MNRETEELLRGVYLAVYLHRQILHLYEWDLR